MSWSCDPPGGSHCPLCSASVPAVALSTGNRVVGLGNGVRYCFSPIKTVLTFLPVLLEGQDEERELGGLSMAVGLQDLRQPILSENTESGGFPAGEGGGGWESVSADLP